MTQASVLVFLGKTLQTLPVLVLRLPRNRQLSYGDGIGVCRNRWRARCREPEFKSQGGSVKLGGASVRFVSLLFDADLVRAGRQPLDVEMAAIVGQHAAKDSRLVRFQANRHLTGGLIVAVLINLSRICSFCLWLVFLLCIALYTTRTLSIPHDCDT